MGKRRRARELALEILFMMDVGKQDLDEVLKNYLKTGEETQEIREFGLQLVEDVLLHRDELDGLISKTAKNWEISRMPVVDRAILRIALCEILYHKETPPKVAIDEAIEIVKKYSTEDSSRFINGILDKIMKNAKILVLFIVVLFFNSFSFGEGKNCYDCHPKLKEKYKKKVIHSPVEEKDCYSCHNDHGSENKLVLKLEGNELCYQCHDSYETEFKKQDRLKGVKLSHFNFPVGRGKSRCIDCHDPHAGNRPKLVYAEEHKPFAERKCTECHMKPEFWQPVQFISEVSAVCLKCHKSREKSFVHSPVKNGECIKCHNPHTSKNKFLLKAENNATLCYLCHENKVKDEVKHNPAGEGDCAACHNPHSSDNKNQLKETGVNLCYLCHDKMTGKGNDHAPVADGDCTSCHKPHSSEHEALLVETKFGGKICYSCHENKAKGKYKHVPADEGGDCMLCHETHTAPNKFLLKKTGLDLCNDCHENKAAKDVKHMPVGKGECYKCHDSHSSPYIYQLRNENNKSLCYMCHDSKEKTKYVHTSVKDGNCKGCHDPHSSSEKYMLRGKGNAFCYICHQSKEKEFNKKVIHKALKEEEGYGCLKCHTHHGSDYYRNLRAEYPEEHQISYTQEEFAFCFMCHDSAITTYKYVKGNETEFRRGELNLHYKHVNQQKKRGRKCTVCHSPHASDNYRLLYDFVPFGEKNFRYNYPIGFSTSEIKDKETGKIKIEKSCLPGCHNRKYIGPEYRTYEQY